MNGELPDWWNAWDKVTDRGAAGSKEYCTEWMDARLQEDVEGMAAGRYQIRGPHGPPESLFTRLSELVTEYGDNEVLRTLHFITERA